MKYFIGIDAGGTKTRMKIVTESIEHIHVNSGESGNINSIGEEQLEKNLHDLIFKSLDYNNLDIKNCLGICIGAAGADRALEKARYTEILKRIGFKQQITIVNDALIALNAASSNQNRILLLSGTGSICYGESETGKYFRCGGWGHILGDEGSGYDIGKKAIAHITKAYDQDYSLSLLGKMVLKHYDLKSPVELINKIYNSRDIKKTVAEASVIVNQAFEKGDETALEILSYAAESLFGLARNVYMKINSDKKVDLVYSGSVLTKSIFIQEYVKKKCLETMPLICILDHQFDAVDGAVKIAAEQYFKSI